MEESKILDVRVNVHNEREKNFVDYINLLIKLNLDHGVDIVHYLNALNILDCLTVQEANDIIDRLININYGGKDQK